jgi:hypothetical protein
LISTTDETWKDLSDYGTGSAGIIEINNDRSLPWYDNTSKRTIGSNSADADYLLTIEID